MLPTPMSPSQHGYAAESLEESEDPESQSGQAAIPEPEEGFRESHLPKSSTKDSRFMHPDDSLLACDVLSAESIVTE